MLPKDLQEKFLGVRDMNKTDAVYQTNQASRAMQIGGLTGSGSHEFMYIAVMESDMIFASMVSFFGFAMGFFVILLNMILLREGTRIQRSLETTSFHHGVAMGLTLMLFVQAMFIIGGNLGVFPLTGITLPFIATGTTSMLVCFAMVGLLMTVSFINVTEQNRQADNKFKTICFMICGMLKKTVRNTGRGLGKGAGKMYKIVKADLDKADFDDSIEEDDDTVEEDDDIEEDDDTVEADDDIEEDDDTVEADDDIEEDDDNSETADVSMSEAIMKKTARVEKAQMRQGRDSGKNTIFDNWDDEGEDEDGL